MAKFKCVECGENQVDDKNDTCDECLMEQEDTSEEEEE